MQHAFKAFMNKIIDYAGLFPPARLPMDDAIRNYLKYKNDADEWMLSRFICPAARLRELEKYRGELALAGQPLSFSFLGRGGESADEFLTGLKVDLDLVNAFKDNHGSHVVVDAYEVRFPAQLIEQSDPRLTTEFLNQTVEVIESQIWDNLSAFYEGAFSENWERTIEALISAICRHNRIVGNKGLANYQPVGYKLRCGGADASAYPTPEQVAYVIQLCRQYQIPLKATAGLHHPLRHFNRAEQVKMHGFLNLFGAGILAEYHELSVEQIQTIIEDESAQNFIFNENEFRWTDLTVTAEQIRLARSRRMISFGSCSFDEPREDLRGLGYL